MANIRDAPVRDAKIIGCIGKGKIIHGYQHNGWCKIFGEPGYVLLSMFDGREILKCMPADNPSPGATRGTSPFTTPTLPFLRSGVTSSSPSPFNAGSNDGYTGRGVNPPCGGHVSAINNGNVFSGCIAPGTTSLPEEQPSPFNTTSLPKATSLPAHAFSPGTQFGAVAPTTPDKLPSSQYKQSPSPSSESNDDDDIIEYGDMDPQSRHALRAEHLEASTDSMQHNGIRGPRHGRGTANFQNPVQWPVVPPEQVFVSANNPLFGKFASFGTAEDDNSPFLGSNRQSTSLAQTDDRPRVSGQPQPWTPIRQDFRRSARTPRSEYLVVGNFHNASSLPPSSEWEWYNQRWVWPKLDIDGRPRDISQYFQVGSPASGNSDRSRARSHPPQREQQHTPAARSRHPSPFRTGDFNHPTSYKTLAFFRNASSMPPRAQWVWWNGSWVWPTNNPDGTKRDHSMFFQQQQVPRIPIGQTQNLKVEQFDISTQRIWKDRPQPNDVPCPNCEVMIRHHWSVCPHCNASFRSQLSKDKAAATLWAPPQSSYLSWPPWPFPNRHIRPGRPVGPSPIVKFVLATLRALPQSS